MWVCGCGWGAGGEPDGQEVAYTLPNTITTPHPTPPKQTPTHNQQPTNLVWERPQRLLPPGVRLVLPSVQAPVARLAGGFPHVLEGLAHGRHGGGRGRGRGRGGGGGGCHWLFGGVLSVLVGEGGWRWGWGWSVVGYSASYACRHEQKKRSFLPRQSIKAAGAAAADGPARMQPRRAVSLPASTACGRG